MALISTCLRLMTQQDLTEKAHILKFDGGIINNVSYLYLKIVLI